MWKAKQKFNLGVWLFIALFFISNSKLLAQEQNSYVHQQSEQNGYVWPTDKAVLQKLDEWRDLKFGVLFHWGLYAVPGIVESWNICSEDWVVRPGNPPYDEYKKWYWGLKDSLNPVNFNPEQWAEVMQDAGMKYMIFTTKHHDGFCMFDSKYTDFSIANGPFRNDERRDVARYVFDAFRQKNFMIGCYFSKPDWHCEGYWNPGYATANRSVNYNVSQHPDWWQSYIKYTQNQLTELTSDYGKLDILWLDGGWVSGSQIDLDGILKGARQRQPGLICVDRAIRGHNENYQTPERGIPDEQLNYPWESCIPLSNDWGWVPNAPFKSPQRVINMLSEIVAKGGCFVLGVGPTAQGIIQPEVVERLQIIGKWMRTYGKAIYATHTTPVYHDGNIWFTADKDNRTLYAIYALPEGETLPSTISWKGNIPVGTVKLLNGNKKLRVSIKNDEVTVVLPKNLPAEPFAISFATKK